MAGGGLKRPNNVLQNTKHWWLERPRSLADDDADRRRHHTFVLLGLAFVVIVDVGLLRPPAASLEREHAREDDTADEMRGRELERGLAEGRGELGRAGGRGGGREGERERGEVRGEVCVGLDGALLKG